MAAPIKAIWFSTLVMVGAFSAAIYSLESGILPDLGEPVYGDPTNTIFYVLLAAGLAISLYILASRVRTGAPTDQAILIKKFFVNVAFAEAVALFGLIYFFVSGNADYSYILTATGFVLVLLLYPGRTI